MSNDKNSHNQPGGSKDKKQSPPSAKPEKTAPNHSKNKVKENITIEKTEKSEDLFKAKPAPKLNSARAKTTSKIIPVFVILLTIVTLIAVFWTTYYQYQFEHDWQKLKIDLDQKIEQQTQLTQSIRQKAENSLQATRTNQSTINQQQQLIQQLKQTLSATHERIRELSGRQQQDWLLAEAEYLIKLAEYKILLEKDKITAINLLKTADEKVLLIGDNTLIKLREAIAQDIANLQLIAELDISGIAVQLDATMKQIPALNMLAYEVLNREEDIQVKEQETQKSSWQQFYERFLTDFVIIKDHSKPVKPLMTPQQSNHLNANIQLALQQAQFALIRSEQHLYHLNLDNAIVWINTYYQNDSTSQTVLKNLNYLRQISVNIDTPSELSAKKRIQSINQQRLYQWLEKSKPNRNVDEEISAETTP